MPVGGPQGAQDANSGVPDNDVERQQTTETTVGQLPLHQAQRSGRLRLGSLEQLHWSSGNREGGREDVGSVNSGSRAGSLANSSYHGGSYYEGSRRGGRFGRTGSVHDISAHGGSHHGGSHHGGNHGGGIPLSEVHPGQLPKGGAGAAGGSVGWYGHPHTHAEVELPGQGGPLQDNTGLSVSSMEAQRPGPPHERVTGKLAPVAKGCWPAVRRALEELQGGLDTAHPRPSSPWGVVGMPLGAFLGILWITGINRYTLPSIDMRVLNPTFGASAVLLFGVPESKLSQPRNFLGGQFVSAVVGCTVRSIFPDSVSWVAGPVGVAFALFFMQLTRTVHPPGGATALMTASMLPRGRWAGWMYVPAIMVGSFGMQIIALVTNLVLTLLVKDGRRYPTFWWGSDNFLGGL